MNRQRLVLVVVLLAFVSVAYAQGQLLRYKWQAGTTLTWMLRSEVKGTMSMTMGAQTMPMENLMQVAAEVITEVKGLDNQGRGQVSVRFGRIEFQASAGPQMLQGQIDPAANVGTMVIQQGVQKQEIPIPPGAIQALAKGISAVVDDRGQVVGVQGLEELVQAVSSIPIAPILLGLMDAPLVVLPADPVSLGQRWTVQMPNPLGGPALTQEFTYKGTDTVNGVRCHGIAVAAQSAMQNIEMPSPMPGVKLVFQTMTAATSGLRALSCDNGHLVAMQQQATQEGRGNLTGQIQGPQGAMPVNMALEMKQQTTIQGQRK